MRAIDLFAGCGGFSAGFTQAGFEITHAVEFDRQIAATYAKNHPDTLLMVDDIKNVADSDVFFEGMADVIIGGPPCQGFSMAGARIRVGFVDDPRNYLFKHYFNIVSRVMPKAFVMENVKGIRTMRKGEVFEEIIKTFESIGYDVQYRVLKMSDCGVPQSRERMILIGCKNSWNFDGAVKAVKLRVTFEKPTVWESISDLERLPVDGTAAIKNHTATEHSDLAMQRMKKIGSGGNFTSLNEDIKSVHSGSYGRLEKDKPAPTITTRFDTPSGGRFIHPTLDRTLTPREAARLQSFPDDFEFLGNKTSVCRQIGNAVPPKAAYFLAELTKELIKDEQ